MDDAALLHAAARHGWVITRADARRAGFSDEAIDTRIASGVLVPLHRGVLAVAGAEGQKVGVAVAASAAVRAGGVVSHTTAAWLHGLRSDPGSLVHVTLPGTGRHRLDPAVYVVHRTNLLRRSDRRVVDGIACTSVERTLLDLGAVLSDVAVERALEAALRERRTDVRRLRVVVDAVGGRGRRGTAALRRILDARGDAPASGSGQELRLERALVAAGLPRPERQVVITVAGRRFRVDHLYRDVRLVIETDSAWHAARTAMLADRQRDRLLASAGYEVMRFMDDELAGGAAGPAADVAAAYERRRRTFARPSA